MIIDWLKKKYKQYKKTEELNRRTSNLYNAKKHALLALSYWKDCDEESDIQIQIENTSTYVKLGK